MKKSGTSASIALICPSLINFIMATSIDVFLYGTLKKFQPNYHHLLNASLGKADFIGRYRTTKTWPLLIVTRANLLWLRPLENEGGEKELPVKSLTLRSISWRVKSWDGRKMIDRKYCTNFSSHLCGCKREVASTIFYIPSSVFLLIRPSGRRRSFSSR